MWKSDVYISFHSVMYGKVWEQVNNWNFLDDPTIRFKYNVQQIYRAHRDLSCP